MALKPDEFYQKERGDTTRFDVRVNTGQMERISALFQLRVFPGYRTPSDFARDAFEHRLQQLEDVVQDPVLMALMKAQRALYEEAELAERVEDIIEHAEKVSRNVRLYADAKDEGGLARTVEALQQVLNNAPTPAHYRVERLLRDAKKALAAVRTKQQWAATLRPVTD